jgi:hypothetical protein
MTPAEGRAQRKALMREIARDMKRQQKGELARLRSELREAYGQKRGALRAARLRCRQARREVRRRLAELSLRVLAELKETTAREKAEALATCRAGLDEARGLVERHKGARLKLVAERKYRAEMRRIESGHRDRMKERARGISKAERRGESDDEVRQNIPPEWLGLFERIRGAIRGSGKKTRTEAFFQYVEEHPDEVLASIDDKTDALIAELEAKERAAATAYRKSVPRRAVSLAVAERLEEAPF